MRFDRRAMEIRVLDEQESIKRDVALSCFARALLRVCGREDGLNLKLPRNVLLRNYSEIVLEGLDAVMEWHSTEGTSFEGKEKELKTARDVCSFLLKNATPNSDEKKYLSIISDIIECGNLSDRIRRAVKSRAKKSGLKDAILSVYLELSGCLRENRLWKG